MVIVPISTPTNSILGLLLFCTLPNYVFSGFLIFFQTDEYKLAPHCNFTNEAENIFICLFAIYVSPSVIYMSISYYNICFILI